MTKWMVWVSEGYMLIIYSTDESMKQHQIILTLFIGVFTSKEGEKETREDGEWKEGNLHGKATASIIE